MRPGDPALVMDLIAASPDLELRSSNVTPSSTTGTQT
jgi:hypothetical protein